MSTPSRKSSCHSGSSASTPNGTASTFPPNSGSIPIDVWGKILDYVVFADVQNSMATCMRFHRQIRPHIRHISIFSPRQLTVAAARAYPGVRSLDLLCFFHAADQILDGQCYLFEEGKISPDRRLVVNADVVARFVPFVSQFPSLRRVFLSVYEWFDDDGPWHMPLNYVESSIEDEGGPKRSVRNDCLFSRSRRPFRADTPPGCCPLRWKWRAWITSALVPCSRSMSLLSTARIALDSCGPFHSRGLRGQECTGRKPSAWGAKTLWMRSTAAREARNSSATNHGDDLLRRDQKYTKMLEKGQRRDLDKAGRMTDEKEIKRRKVAR